MKYLLILFVFFFTSNSYGQELMNFYIEPNGTDEITLHTMVYNNTFAYIGGYEVSFDENNINVTLCYLLTSASSLTFDTQINNIVLPSGFNSYNLNLELYGDGDGQPCTLENLADTGTLTFDYPYNLTATTYIPDNVFEDYLEDLGFGDGIAFNDLVFTHRIINNKLIFLGPGIFPLSGDVYNMEGLQDFINLKELRCFDHQITNLDVSNNSKLEWLWCNGNPISELDITNNVTLKILWAGGMELSTIELTNNINLENLIVYSNNLSTIDVSQNINLKELRVGSNPIDNIDVSNNILLESFYSNNTLITSLDVSNNTNLKNLYIFDNTLSSINLDNNLLLENVTLFNNQFTDINISNLINLKFFDAWNNQFTSLDFSNNPLVENIYIFDNNLSLLNIKNGNNSNIEQLVVVNNDNLFCIEVDDPSEAPYDGWSTDSQVIYSEDCSLGLVEVLETQISIFPNPAKDVLYLYNESTTKVTSVKVYDSLGRFVLEYNNPSNQIDISNLSNGLLFVKIETNQGSLFKKIIKE